MKEKNQFVLSVVVGSFSVVVAVVVDSFSVVVAVFIRCGSRSSPYKTTC